MDSGRDVGRDVGKGGDRSMSGRLGAVILAGGTAARMDGVDKAGVELHGRTLLEIAIEALADADEIVVVSPHHVATARPVTYAREDPPLGGPVAGILAGVDALSVEPHLVAVLAVDMARVTAHTVRRLVEAADGHDGAFLTDADGRRQLAGVLWMDQLDRVRSTAGDPHGMALHRLLAPLDLTELSTQGDEASDVDSWADLHRLEHGPDQQPSP